MNVVVMLQNVPKDAKGQVEVKVYDSNGGIKDIQYLDTNDKRVELVVFSGDRIGMEKFALAPVYDKGQMAAVPPVEV